MSRWLNVRLATLFVSIFSQFFIGEANAGVDFSKSADKVIVGVLGSISKMDEMRLNSGLDVKVFSLQGSGSCDPGHEAKTCPRSQILVVRSIDFEGASDPVLWKSGKFIGLKVTSELKAASKGVDATGFGVVEFNIQGCEASSPVERGVEPANKDNWWREKSYTVKVSSEGVVVEPISGPAGRLCSLY